MRTALRTCSRGTMIARRVVTSCAVLLTAVLLACSPNRTPEAREPGLPTQTAAVLATATASRTEPPSQSSTPAPRITSVATGSQQAPAGTASPSTGALAAREIERGSAARAEIAFTINCAANTGPTEEILDVLRDERVRTTWFIVGLWARDHPDVMKRIALEHEVGSHSWGHPDYRDLTDEQIVADLQELESFIVALTGRSTKPLWRAPSGARDDRVIRAAAAAGWSPHIFWTIGQDAGGTVTGDNGDWRSIPAAEVLANMRRAIGLGNGTILVAHCDSPATATVLRDAIRAVRAADMRIVTVSELLRP